MTDQRRTHSAKNLQEFIEQMARRRSGHTPPALEEDPWGDDKPVATPGEEPPRGSNNPPGRSSNAPTPAHARAAATLGRPSVPPPTRPPSSPPLPEPPPPPPSARIKTDPPVDDWAKPEPAGPAELPSERPERVGRPRLRDSAPRVGRPPLRDSSPRASSPRVESAPSRPSEKRVSTERPAAREPSRVPVIVLSALVAGSIGALMVVKAMQYAEKPHESPAAETVVATATLPPTAAEQPAATAPAAAPSSEPPAAPAAAAPAAEPAATAPAAAAPVAAAPPPEPSAQPAAAQPAAAQPVAAAAPPALPPEHVASSPPAPSPAREPAKAVDKAPKVRPRPAQVARPVARSRPAADPPAEATRSERTDDKPAPEPSRREVTKVEAPPPEPPKPKAPEPAAPDPSRSAARSDPPAPRPGTIDVAATRAAVRAQLGPVQQCYERAKMDDPGLAGTVTARITVGADGSVTKVDIIGSTLSAPAAEACIRQGIARWHLPRPSGGASASLTYPLVFQ